MLNKYSALNTPKNHFGSEPQKRPDRVFQAKMNRNSYTVFIPEKIDLENLIKWSPPDFPFNIDEAKYILHLISYNRFKKKKDNTGYKYWQKSDYPYTMLHSQLLQGRIRKYNSYLNYFIDSGIIETDGFYIKGEKSLGYKFTSEYSSPVKESLITKKALIKSIHKFIKLDNSETKEVIINKDISEYGYLNKWFNEKLTIDYKAAKEYIFKELLYDTEQMGLEIAMIRYNQRLIGIKKLHRGTFINTIDVTAGRMHTILTQLKSDLRQFIRYDGKKLVALDIRNSQPYLSLAFLDYDLIKKFGLVDSIKLYNKNFDESIFLPSNLYYVSKNEKEYIKLVSDGLLYERFIEYMLENGELNLLEDRHHLRKIVKGKVIEGIYSHNSSIAYKRYMKAFKELFPDVYFIFNEIKKGKGKSHRALACVLQNFEAKLVLDIAAKEISLKHPDLPIFTIHDSIITTEGNEHKVKGILNKVLSETIGIEPELKEELWAA